jgi:hypothetical protein
MGAVVVWSWTAGDGFWRNDPASRDVNIQESRRMDWQSLAANINRRLDRVS